MKEGPDERSDVERTEKVPFFSYFKWLVYFQRGNVAFRSGDDVLWGFFFNFSSSFFVFVGKNGG
jgi:hypothetical protein